MTKEIKPLPEMPEYNLRTDLENARKSIDEFLKAKPMNAREVLERSKEMAEILGLAYGRLQNELLTPLVNKTFDILKDRGCL